jgi:hypothetical protein
MVLVGRNISGAAVWGGIAGAYTIIHSNTAASSFALTVKLATG